MPEIILIPLAKKLFRIFKNEVRNQKSSPINYPNTHDTFAASKQTSKSFSSQVWKWCSLKKRYSFDKVGNLFWVFKPLFTS